MLDGDKPTSRLVHRDGFSIAKIESKLQNPSVGFGDGMTVPHGLRLFQRELRALDVSRMMGFQQQCALAHPPHPLIRQRGRIQKPPSPLDLRQIASDGIGDSERRVHVGEFSKRRLLFWEPCTLGIPARDATCSYSVFNGQVKVKAGKNAHPTESH